MNIYPDLFRQMAEAYINSVRDLETRVRELEQENHSLRQIITELREANDIYWEEHRHE